MSYSHAVNVKGPYLACNQRPVVWTRAGTTKELRKSQFIPEISKISKAYTRWRYVYLRCCSGCERRNQDGERDSSKLGERMHYKWI